MQAQMQGLDKDVFNKTGRVTTSMTNDWEEKARQRALANSENRMENHGRVHIGNGKWMDQAEIDAIAQARLQPTLDEISDKAEKRRAEDAERQFELEKKKRNEQEEKARQAEIKAEEKKGKGNTALFTHCTALTILRGGQKSGKGTQCGGESCRKAG